MKTFKDHIALNEFIAQYWRKMLLNQQLQIIEINNYRENNETV
jgi:hypothetical protein